MALELPGRLREILGADAKTRVVVVERGAQPGGRWSQELRDVIIEASAELGVEWLVNAEVECVDASGVTLKDGQVIASQTVIWTVGVQANSLTAQINAPRDRQGRLHVNANLQVVGHDDIYATGDVAYAATDDKGNHALMTCQHAILLGKFAGNNAAADLLDVTPLPYRQENYVTCLDLGAWGAVYSEGWDQQVKLTRAEAKQFSAPSRMRPTKTRCRRPDKHSASGNSAHQVGCGLQRHAAVGLISTAHQAAQRTKPDAANALSGLQTTRCRRPDKRSASGSTAHRSTNYAVPA